MNKKKIVLGMSGGTDSSMSAVLLQEAGYEVIGVTFRFFEKEENTEYLDDARALAERIGIQHIVQDHRTIFKEKIITYFVNEYMEGRTPVPCVLCNNYFKWPLLIALANEIGADFVATGHYAKVEKGDDRYYITKGADPDKDQSFFLWGLTQEIMTRMVLPLGNYTKTEVRRMAAERGFERAATKKDSLGVCFCPGDYRSFLREWTTKTIVPGNYVDSEGNILGRHEGYPYYTVGQRRGLGIHLNRQIFVKAINKEHNEVTISSMSELFHSTIILKDWHLTIDATKSEPENHPYICKIRYRKQATPCRFTFDNEGHMVIKLGEPLHAIAEGQAAALYDGDRVVGGGIILTKE